MSSDHYTPVKPAAVVDGETADASDINNISDAVETAFETLESEIDSLVSGGASIASPGSSTDNGILIWDGSGGTAVIESGWQIDDATFQMIAGGEILTDYLAGSNTNTLLGVDVCSNGLLAGVQNTFVGYGVGSAMTSGIGNTMVGCLAGFTLIGAYNYNTFVGTQAGYSALSANCTYVGYKAGRSTFRSSQESVCIGVSAGEYSGGGTQSVLVGYRAGYVLNDASTQYNTMVGGSAGVACSTGWGNTFFGYAAGSNVTTADRCIAIGFLVSCPSASTDYQMTIGNLIYGTNVNGTATTASTGNVGIGAVPDDTAKLDIKGDILRLRTAKTPATAGATGVTGSICWDSDYVYVCVDTDTWKRAALSTW